MICSWNLIVHSHRSWFNSSLNKIKTSIGCYLFGNISILTHYLSGQTIFSYHPSPSAINSLFGVFPKNDPVGFWLFFPNMDFSIIMTIRFNWRIVRVLFRVIVLDFSILQQFAYTIRHSNQRKSDITVSNDALWIFH